MKVVDVAEQHPPFDVPSGLAQSLIAAGTHKQYVSNKPKTQQQLTWKACRGSEYNGVLEPPFIFYRCSGCSNSGQISGPTCHRTQTVRCCGSQAKVPDDIAEQFAKLRKEYEPNNRKYQKAVQQAAQYEEKKRQAVLEQERRLLAKELRTGTSVTAIED
jgi:hypothetical protein